MIVGPDDCFYIEDGVHRAVAAREAELTAILAKLIRDGMEDELILVRLDRLCSPKERVGRWDHRRDLFDLVALLKTPIGRAKMPEISVQPLGAAGQTRSIPLTDVEIDLG